MIHSYIDTAFATSLAKDDFTREFLEELMERTRGGELCVHRAGIRDEMAYLVEGEKSPLVCFEDHYYLRRCFELERSVLHHLKRLHFAKPKFSNVKSKFSLYAAQEEALSKGLTNTVLLISGGPGTGKTYLANALIEAVLEQKPNASILFTAPTGKASFRIKHPAITQGTLHNMLGIREKSFDAKPLMYDFIIADECSMIDAKLFSLFLSSIPRGTHLILMGDPDQLSPVEAGSIFPQFFSLPLEKIHLNQSMRSDRKGILTLASHIRQNDIDAVFSLLYDPVVKDVQLVPFPKSPPIPLNDSITFLTPFRNTTLSYNTFIEANKNPSLKTPLIITKNDYKRGLMNGDIGWKEGNFGTFSEQKIPLSLLTEYDLAWTISIHKSQGSEFDHVLILLPEGSDPFGRELIYTAITRAKKSVTIASSPETLHQTLLTRKNPTPFIIKSSWDTL